MVDRSSTDTEDTDLRLLVDIVWQHATESTAVPFHKTSDMLIAKYRQCFPRVAQAQPDLALRNAALDALAGWKYIRGHHGDLYGVGWDRVETALEAALAVSSTDQRSPQDSAVSSPSKRHE